MIKIVSRSAKTLTSLEGEGGDTGQKNTVEQCFQTLTVRCDQVAEC